MNAKAFVVFAAAGVVSALHAQVIDTTPRNSFLDDLGPNDTPFYGQSFFVSAPAVLTSFTFQMQGYGNTASFTARIGEWNSATSTLIGSSLWTSSTFPGDFSGLFVDYSFSPNLTLAGGKSYLFYVEALGPAQIGTPLDYYMFVAGRDDNPYLGGEFFSSLTGTGAWSETTSTTDLAFRATFVAVPEPGTYGLIGALGLVALVAAKRLKKSSQEAGEATRSA